MYGEIVYVICKNCNHIGFWRKGILHPYDGKVKGECQQCGSPDLQETMQKPPLVAHRERMAGAPQ